MEADVLHRGVGSIEQLAGLAFCCGVVDYQFDALVAG
jgi:hypothetical protein